MAAPLFGQIETAGELFVELDAANFVDGERWPNSGTLGDFEGIFGDPFLGEHAGAPGIVFDGSSAIQGPIAPESIAGSNDRTIEVWAMNPVDNGAEETMVAWGRRGAPCLSTESFTYGLHALTHWCEDLLWFEIPPYGKWHHLVYTYENVTGVSHVYSDGQEINRTPPQTLVTHASRITIGSQLCSPGDAECIEGESLAGDEFKFSGTIGRIRIHDGVLDDFQIANNYDLERPEFTIPLECADIPNAPTEDTIFVGTETYKTYLDIVGEPPLQVEVLSPAGAILDDNNGTLAYPIPNPNSPGSFEVSVRVSNDCPDPSAKTVSWTVTIRNPPSPGDPIETAGEVFIDLSAADETAGEASWANAGTLADLTEVGDPVKAEVLGIPAVALNLGETLDAYTTQEDAPAGLVGKNPTRTIEVWALNPSVDGEEGMVSWGSRGEPGGSVLSFTYGPHAITHWHHDVQWNPPGMTPSAGDWHHLVYTHDGAASRIYVDGTEVTSRTDLLGLINTDTGTKIALGTQFNTGGDLDAGFRFSGYLGQVRVHDGVLRAEQVFHNHREEVNLYGGPPVLEKPEDEMAFDDRTYRRPLEIQSLIETTAEVLEPAAATIALESGGGGGAQSVLVPPGENVVVSIDIPDPAPVSFNVHVKVTNALGEDEATWEVTLKAPPTRPGPGEIETAGELFVWLDAIDSSAGTLSWANFGTLEDFLRIGNPYVTFHNGIAGVAFNTTAIGDAYQSEDDAPDGLVGFDPTRSIECWVFNPELDDEDAMVAWGGRHEPTTGSNMSFNSGSSPGAGAVIHFHAPDMGWGDQTPTAGQWHYLVYTLDGTTARVYSDGVLFNAKEVAGQIATLSPSKILLGTQNQDDGVTPTFEPARVGRLSLAIVRVHDGVLDADQIESNFNLEAPQFGLGPPEVVFRRGDHDGSGLVDITDSLNRLSFLFLGTFAPNCRDASDFDNSGAVDITDSINELTFLFLGTVVPPDPGTTNCGPDPDVETDDGDDPPPNGPDGLPPQPAVTLGCDEYPSPDFLPDAACP